MSSELKAAEKLEKYYLTLSLLKIIITWPNWFLFSFKKECKDRR